MKSLETPFAIRETPVQLAEACYGETAYLETQPSPYAMGLLSGTHTDAPACMAISLRSVSPEDDDFIFKVYSSTRTTELEITGWDSRQKNAFLLMQFDAQKSSYKDQFPGSGHWVIQFDETAIGRMILDRTGSEILLIDIALLPEFHHMRIGSLLMAGVLKEAALASKPVRLHVERFNPALLWYQRLGFTPVREDAIYFEMIWKP